MERPLTVVSDQSVNNGDHLIPLLNTKYKYERNDRLHIMDGKLQCLDWHKEN